MIASCAGVRPEPRTAAATAGTASGPTLISMNVRVGRPAGIVASASASVGSRSPAQRAPYQLPASSPRSSSSALSRTTFATPVVRRVFASWMTIA